MAAYPRPLINNTFKLSKIRSTFPRPSIMRPANKLRYFLSGFIWFVLATAVSVSLWCYDQRILHSLLLCSPGDYAGTLSTSSLPGGISGQQIPLSSSPDGALYSPEETVMATTNSSIAPFASTRQPTSLSNDSNERTNSTHLDDSVTSPSPPATTDRFISPASSSILTKSISSDQVNRVLYWNLSCPLEMSSFSAVRLGGPDYLPRANKARDLARKMALPLIPRNWTRGIPYQRVFFVGDSLLRQLFISLSCLSDTDYMVVPWYVLRSGRTNHVNAIRTGPHSKFEEARVWMSDPDTNRGATELIYHHGLGSLLELGSEYQSHDPHDWLESCFRGEPMKTQVVARPATNVYTLTEKTVTRETLTLTPRDIIVLNGSVHGQRPSNLRNIADLMNCLNFHPAKKRRQLWPDFVYFVTGAEHFPTPSGRYEGQILEQLSIYNCTLASNQSSSRLEEEKKILQDNNIPLVGLDTLDWQYRSGDLHVGGRDCLHWAMPGIPDVLAASLVQHLTQATAPTIP